MARKTDSFAFYQDRFQEEYEKIQQDEKSVSRESIRRRGIAYGFKLLAVLGGVAVAAGVSQSVAQVIGIAIAVAVGLDAVFSNHERLISVVAARNAYQRLLNQTSREHTQRLGPILQKKESGNEAAAKAEATQLCSELIAKLHSEAEKVEDGLRDADLKALRSISLEAGKDARK